jgi:hypothetical protein
VLEEDNAELREKLDEITDKQYHCVGIQTIKPVLIEQAVNTVKTEEVLKQATKQQQQ